MGNAITTAILVIAGTIAAAALVNAVLPAMGKGSGALMAANSEAANRVRTDVEIIHAVGDTTADTVTVWVKNIGTHVIKPVTASDVILTTPTTVKRLPYVSGCASECWDYVIEESATDWSWTETVKFTLKITSVTTGTYTITISTFNGISATKYFTV